MELGEAGEVLPTSIPCPLELTPPSTAPNTEEEEVPSLFSNFAGLSPETASTIKAYLQRHNIHRSVFGRPTVSSSYSPTSSSPGSPIVNSTIYLLLNDIERLHTELRRKDAEIHSFKTRIRHLEQQVFTQSQSNATSPYADTSSAHNSPLNSPEVNLGFRERLVSEIMMEISFEQKLTHHVNRRALENTIRSLISGDISAIVDSFNQSSHNDVETVIFALNSWASKRTTPKSKTSNPVVACVRDKEFKIMDAKDELSPRKLSPSVSKFLKNRVDRLSKNNHIT
ncbi:hypothetical protein P9112_012393 [Eukaryota sp. TZLM1-RC]